MKSTINITTFLSLLFSSFNMNGQEPISQNDSAQLLHQNGQIYLVVLVLVTIFAGIIFYLTRLEKKLRKLENEKTSNK